jgi:hypothetical protein
MAPERENVARLGRDRVHRVGQDVQARTVSMQEDAGPRHMDVPPAKAR